MLGPSLKSVPGCLVSIVPMLIGVPEALTPGLGPHFEVSAELPPLEPPAAALEVPPLADAAPELLLLLLLPQPARTSTSAITASSARNMRVRGTTCLVLTDLSSPQNEPCLGIRPEVAGILVAPAAACNCELTRRQPRQAGP